MLNKLFEQFDRLIFLDVETSGLNPKHDEIIELGAVSVCQNEGVPFTDKKISMLVRLSEGKRLSPEITELTGITQSELDEKGVSKSEICSALIDLFDNGHPLVVAYNAQFDLCFLYYLLDSFGKAKVLKNIKMLDALTVYKDRRDYPHRLENAVAEYALETKSTHRAIDDAVATYALLCAMEKECSDLEHYINLFGYNPKYGVSGPKISSVTYVPQKYNRERKLYDL
ncbi:MAG: 3'-5' exonuclease [Clostridiales bacterium]|jgi:DNA polymerase-3 subunit epsilon|nr:3'-5' exonuclease [Clostridiales bacterium]